MWRLNLSRMACIAFVFCAATAVSSDAQTFTTLVNFNFTDGLEPEASLIRGTDGNFYGTTRFGGANPNNCNIGSAAFGCGTVFKVTPGGTLTTVHSFNSADGAGPGALVQATDGNFYGATSNGGANNIPVCAITGAPVGCGTVFKITPGGVLTSLHSFDGTDGFEPTGGLVQASDGNLYGTTFAGGANNVPACTVPPYNYVGCGTVFKITPGGTLTTLHSFDGTDGFNPNGLMQATDGNFYGTTHLGGVNGGGTVFKITPAGVLTTLHSFNFTDGAYPLAALVQATDGVFYGTTYQYGANGDGTAFKIAADGTLTTLYNFCALTGCADGTNPSGLIQATDGNFYGETFAGGANCTNIFPPGCGTVFKITAGGALTTLHTFDRADGFEPTSGLIQGTDGNFYGTTIGGGANLEGTVFRLSAKPVEGDFDGDHKSDIAVWRPSNGTWFVIPSSAPNNAIVQQWGTSGDIPVRGDYDGDGKTDIAVWRPSSGTWFLIPSSNTSSPIVRQWGTNGDIPVPGDYDGDGKTDFAVFRPSNGTWFIIPSSNPGAPIVRQWGTNGDIPVPGDYDGDGKTDFAVWRPSNGTWFIIPSSNPSSPIVRQWGTTGDIPVPGDYDGDGKTDMAVFRPSLGMWFIVPSSNTGAPILQQWGTLGDIPVPVDYDGDGKTDIAVWRPSSGNWFIISSLAPSTFTITQWGTNGDVPVQKPIGQ